MARATLTKNTMVLRYQTGVDTEGNPKYTTQKFSRIKIQATDSGILEVGESLNRLIDSENKEVLKEENYILGNE